MVYPPAKAKKVKLIFGFIYQGEQVYIETKKTLIKKFGGIDFESSKIDFNFTDYYYKELGEPLFRRFISFKKLRMPSDFVRIKLFSLKLEKRMSEGNKRRINIDPGYLNEAKLVLTTTKDYSHRIYLGKGVYGEVSLYYHAKEFCGFPTTYPDYRTAQYKELFQTIREIYRQQIRPSD